MGSNTRRNRYVEYRILPPKPRREPPCERRVREEIARKGCCPGWKAVAVAVIVIVLLLLIPAYLSFVDGREYSLVKNASVAQLNATDYDYIIVGGGTAGYPLAAILSLNYSVLLLERGNTPYGNPDIESAANFGQLISNIHGNTWISPVESFQSQDGVFIRRARVLGGGTAINAGFYSRASDEYEARAGWDEGMAGSAYTCVEAAVAFAPRLRQWHSAVRDALLEVGIGPDNGNSYEHEKGTKEGGSICHDAGKHHTAADLLQHANSDNITVLLFANVHRILFAPAVPGSPPRASGVVFSDSLGLRHQAFLRQDLKSEVLVAAEALVGSPHLLILSGVGNAAEINSEDSPEVRFNYFSAPEDLFTRIETTRVVQIMMKTEAMVNFTNTSFPDAARQKAPMIGSFMPDDLDVPMP